MLLITQIELPFELIAYIEDGGDLQRKRKERREDKALRESNLLLLLLTALFQKTDIVHCLNPLLFVLGLSICLSFLLPGKFITNVFAFAIVAAVAADRIRIKRIGLLLQKCKNVSAKEFNCRVNRFPQRRRKRKKLSLFLM